MNKPSVPVEAYKSALKNVKPMTLELASEILYALASRRCALGRYNRLRRTSNGSWYLEHCRSLNLSIGVGGISEVDSKYSIRVSGFSPNEHEPLEELIVEGNGVKGVELTLDYWDMTDANPYTLIATVYDLDLERFATTIHGAEHVDCRWVPYSRMEDNTGFEYDSFRDEVLKGLNKEELSDFTPLVIKSVESEISLDVGFDPSSIEYQARLRIESEAAEISKELAFFVNEMPYLVDESDLAELAYRISKAKLIGSSKIYRDHDGKWIAQLNGEDRVIYFDQLTALCAGNNPVDYFESKVVDK